MGHEKAQGHIFKVSGLSKVQHLLPEPLVSALSAFHVLFYNIRAMKNFYRKERLVAVTFGSYTKSLSYNHFKVKPSNHHF